MSWSALDPWMQKLLAVAALATPFILYWMGARSRGRRRMQEAWSLHLAGDSLPAGIFTATLRLDQPKDFRLRLISIKLTGPRGAKYREVTGEADRYGNVIYRPGPELPGTTMAANQDMLPGSFLADGRRMQRAYAETFFFVQLPPSSRSRRLEIDATVESISSKRSTYRFAIKSQLID